MKVKDYITYLSRAYSPDKEICFIEWTDDDVRLLAEDNGIKLTDKQVANVLDTLAYVFDASAGISWDTVGYAIDEVLKRDE